MSAGDVQVYGWHYLDHPHTVDLLDLSRPHRPSWLAWRLDQRCTGFDGFAGGADTSTVASMLSVGSGEIGTWSGAAVPDAPAFALFGAARMTCDFPRTGRPEEVRGPVFRAER